MNTWDTMEGLNERGKAKRWLYLESQSTTTMMTNLLRRPTIKSMEILVKMVDSIGSGCHSLRVSKVSLFSIGKHHIFLQN